MVSKTLTMGGMGPPIVKVFETIGLSKVAKSAAEARELKFLRAGDRITMNRDRLLVFEKDTGQRVL